MDCACPIAMAPHQEAVIRRDVFFETDRLWEPLKRYFKDLKDGARNRHNCQRVRETVRAYEQHLSDICFLSENSLSKALSANLRSQKEFADRFMRGVTHVGSCKNSNCRMPTCIRLKAVSGHVTSGKCPFPKDGQNPCPTCMQMSRVCVAHVISCHAQDQCPVPLCDLFRPS